MCWCWPKWWPFRGDKPREPKIFVGYPVDEFDGMFTSPLMNEILL